MYSRYALYQFLAFSQKTELKRLMTDRTAVKVKVNASHHKEARSHCIALGSPEDVDDSISHFRLIAFRFASHRAVSFSDRAHLEEIVQDVVRLERPRKDRASSTRNHSSELA
jgi:hypothetical protein